LKIGGITWIDSEKSGIAAIREELKINPAAYAAVFSISSV
jgi:hypothetical protein